MSRKPSRSRLRRDDEKERRREALIDAAEAVFARHGFEAAKMEDVARRARVSRALVYVYFKNKAELQFAVCRRALRVLRERLSAAADGEKRGYDKIVAIGRAYMAFASEFPLYFAALSRFEAHQPDRIDAGSSERAVLEAGVAVHEVTIAALTAGARDGTIARIDKPMLVALTLWGYTHGAIQIAQTKAAFLEEVGLSADEFLAHAIRFGLQGLRPAKGAKP
ncbi:TetR/AcrR family transcriptional regulator [Solimonas soli]|uniref:TetR/AcrR family transcriptional regulator n=1 Tax=Solimonas soli TaxID=413479 RepID=UPI000483D7F0|nr:TetR/AcrR family transcriptional regulator [Solimonas soli]